jgi:hypothetical protein
MAPESNGVPNNCANVANNLITAVKSKLGVIAFFVFARCFLFLGFILLLPITYGLIISPEAFEKIIWATIIFILVTSIIIAIQFYRND